jgi:hypothetical protein
VIIREGLGNIKYTHDKEALIEAWLRMREFAGISKRQMLSWIDHTPYYSKAYWHFPETDFFRPTSEFLYSMDKKDAERIELYEFKDFTLLILERYGFSCVVCGARRKWKQMGKLYRDWRDRESPRMLIARAVEARQTAPAPDLLCMDCAIDLPMMLLPFVTQHRRMKAVEALVNRSKAWSKSRPVVDLRSNERAILPGTRPQA